MPRRIGRREPKKACTSREFWKAWNRHGMDRQEDDLRICASAREGRQPATQVLESGPYLKWILQCLVSRGGIVDTQQQWVIRTAPRSSANEVERGKRGKRRGMRDGEERRVPRREKMGGGEKLFRYRSAPETSEVETLATRIRIGGGIPSHKEGWNAYERMTHIQPARSITSGSEEVGCEDLESYGIAAVSERVGWDGQEKSSTEFEREAEMRVVRQER
ncbi:hypothetical protein B0H17DRAFT_1131067 [Mycena rosella]|uniref:Uncharacterized protein n=1 Tax=Mycena rosella TaxID=1033263 RepID=A0AAD7DNX1_MYCRO|nr:hypothetical protein B0H17DRAFT_1131067 [Mycena rosella]